MQGQLGGQHLTLFTALEDATEVVLGPLSRGQWTNIVWGKVLVAAATVPCASTHSLWECHYPRDAAQLQQPEVIMPGSAWVLACPPLPRDTIPTPGRTPMPSPFARTHEPAGHVRERKVLEAKGEQDGEENGGWEMETCAPCRRWLATKLQQEMGAFLQALPTLRASVIPIWEAKVDVPRPGLQPHTLPGQNAQGCTGSWQGDRPCGDACPSPGCSPARGWQAEHYSDHFQLAPGPWGAVMG